MTCVDGDGIRIIVSQAMHDRTRATAVYATLIRIVRWTATLQERNTTEIHRRNLVTTYADPSS